MSSYGNSSLPPLPHAGSMQPQPNSGAGGPGVPPGLRYPQQYGGYPPSVPQGPYPSLDPVSARLHPYGLGPASNQAAAAAAAAAASGYAYAGLASSAQRPNPHAYQTSGPRPILPGYGTPQGSHPAYASNGYSPYGSLAGNPTNPSQMSSGASAPPGPSPDLWSGQISAHQQARLPYSYGAGAIPPSNRSGSSIPQLGSSNPAAQPSNQSREQQPPPSASSYLNASAYGAQSAPSQLQPPRSYYPGGVPGMPTSTGPLSTSHQMSSESNNPVSSSPFAQSGYGLATANRYPQYPAGGYGQPPVPSQNSSVPVYDNSAASRLSSYQLPGPTSGGPSQSSSSPSFRGNYAPGQPLSQLSPRRPTPTPPSGSPMPPSNSSDRQQSQAQSNQASNNSQAHGPPPPPSSNSLAQLEQMVMPHLAGNKSQQQGAPGSYFGINALTGNQSNVGLNSSNNQSAAQTSSMPATSSSSSSVAAAASSLGYPPYVGVPVSQAGAYYSQYGAGNGSLWPPTPSATAQIKSNAAVSTQSPLPPTNPSSLSPYSPATSAPSASKPTNQSGYSLFDNQYNSNALSDSISNSSQSNNAYNRSSDISQMDASKPASKNESQLDNTSYYEMMSGQDASVKQAEQRAAAAAHSRYMEGNGYSMPGANNSTGPTSATDSYLNQSQSNSSSMYQHSQPTGPSPYGQSMPTYSPYGDSYDMQMNPQPGAPSASNQLNQSNSGFNASGPAGGQTSGNDSMGMYDANYTNLNSSASQQQPDYLQGSNDQQQMPPYDPYDDTFASEPVPVTKKKPKGRPKKDPSEVKKEKKPRQPRTPKLASSPATPGARGRGRPPSTNNAQPTTQQMSFDPQTGGYGQPMGPSPDQMYQSGPIPAPHPMSHVAAIQASQQQQAMHTHHLAAASVGPETYSIASHQPQHQPSLSQPPVVSHLQAAPPTLNMHDTVASPSSNSMPQSAPAMNSAGPSITSQQSIVSSASSIGAPIISNTSQPLYTDPNTQLSQPTLSSTNSLNVDELQPIAGNQSSSHSSSLSTSSNSSLITPSVHPASVVSTSVSSNIGLPPPLSGNNSDQINSQSLTSTLDVPLSTDDVSLRNAADSQASNDGSLHVSPAQDSVTKLQGSPYTERPVYCSQPPTAPLPPSIPQSDYNTQLTNADSGLSNQAPAQEPLNGYDSKGSPIASNDFNPSEAAKIEVDSPVQPIYSTPAPSFSQPINPDVSVTSYDHHSTYGNTTMNDSYGGYTSEMPSKMSMESSIQNETYNTSLDMNGSIGMMDHSTVLPTGGEISVADPSIIESKPPKAKKPKKSKKKRVMVDETMIDGDSILMTDISMTVSIVPPTDTSTLITPDGAEVKVKPKRKRPKKKPKEKTAEFDLLPPPSLDENALTDGTIANETPGEMKSNGLFDEATQEEAEGEDKSPKKKRPSRSRPRLKEGSKKKKLPKLALKFCNKKKRKRLGSSDGSDGERTPPPSPKEEDNANKRRSARNTTKKLKYHEDIDLGISDDDDDDSNKQEVQVTNIVEDTMIVEKIMGCRMGKRELELEEHEIETPDRQPQMVEVEEFYVKYKNLSYLHCDWKTEEELEKGDRRVGQKLKRYKQKKDSLSGFDFQDEEYFNPDYCEVDRILDVTEFEEPIPEDAEPEEKTEKIEESKVTAQETTIESTETKSSNEENVEKMEVETESVEKIAETVLSEEEQPTVKTEDAEEMKTETAPATSSEEKKEPEQTQSTIAEVETENGHQDDQMQQEPKVESDDSAENPATSDCDVKAPAAVTEDEKETKTDLDNENISKPRMRTVRHFLVKWRGLPYEESTWELEDDLDVSKIEQFYRFRICPSKDKWKPKRKPKASEWKKKDESPVYKNGNTLREYQLEGVNWLMFCWYNG